MAARQIKKQVEKHIYKVTYPSGTVKYRVEFFGKAPLYRLVDSLEEAQEIKAKHYRDNPEIVPKDAEAKRKANVKRAASTKVPGTKFISEYNTRPGVYAIRMARAKEQGGKKISFNETVKGLANAKKREKQLIAKLEKLTGRNIDDTIDGKKANPIYDEAVADVKKQMTKWNKLGYYPEDILVKTSDKYNLPYQKGEGANRQLTQYVKKAGLIDDELKGVSSKYLDAIAEYDKYKGDKTKVGVKKSILEKLGLPSKAANVATFRMALSRLGKNVTEDIKLEGEQTQRNITKKLGEKSALNIEDFLTGKKMGDLQVTGKKGSLLDKMHLADKAGLIRIGEMGYGSSELNQMLGGGFRRTEGAERHRVALNKHMDKIIKKFKGKPDAMYTISPGPDSFDQKKFKNALQREFGKSKGQVPLVQYIDKILNEEARLMGTATDGLITTRQIDPITLERMKPSYGLSGSRTLPPVGQITDDLTLQELGLEKKQAGFKRVTPRLEDLETSANLAFQSADSNIKKMKLSPSRMKGIVDSIDKMLAGGLQNAKYEEISRLAKQCTLLRAEGGRIAFAEGGPCAQAQKAVRSLDNTDMIKIGSNIDPAMQGPLGKIRNIATGFLRSGGVKTFGVAGLAGGAAAALVKEFRNDDPTTYLSNEDQQKNMLVDMVTQPISEDMTRPDILDFQLPAVGASLAASTALGAPSTIKASRSRGLGVEQKGLIRTGGRVLGRGLGIAASPGVLAPLAALDITRQVSEGDSIADIATDPVNYTYPIFAEQTDKLTRGLSPTLRKAARLGMSKPALRLLSRAGIAGLGASLAIQGIGLLDD